MHPTLEVRWFFRGRLPEEFYRWFPEAGADKPETRTDWYLYSPDRGLGIKLREGGLEIKQRLANQGKSKLAKRVRGRVEQWLKWHFPIEQTADGAMAELGESWMPVAKKRWCQHYAFTPDGAIQRVDSEDSEELMQQGCTLELSELQVWNQDWHSLCFEAFGPPEMLDQILTNTVQQVHHEIGLPVLKARDSFGYPAWLHWVRQKAP
ncbi:hypothetical protein HJG54_07720 [Leptolyngbya sp. NK1-12]|uniref:Uncharacterized protein n=1 Tax=Leptolyngbya sp. NK1-12 TaxID=2547451 RepID=A0AA96WTK3_9CYAN|nr:hypothetical protein [Leptolyngbya sp. NK1-12]WNZ22752.1 hypothetical protein HJG54_07720 [Leptolyngbya sp. NK1-12]